MKMKLAAMIVAALPAFQQISAQCASPSGGGAKTVHLSRNTGLKLALIRPLSSATARVGDDVELRLERPVVMEGVTLLSEGIIIHGKVTEAKPAGPYCRRGKLKWRIDHIPLPDSTSVSSRICSVRSQANLPVAEQLDPRHCMVVRGRRGEIESQIVYAPLVALGSPFILANAIFGNRHKCVGQGNDISYPANTTVAVLITAERTVSYTSPPQ